LSARTGEHGDGVRWHCVDLLRADEVSGLMAQVAPTHLLHLAWFVKPGVYWSSPVNLAWLGASLEIVRSFVESGGRRAVLVGSCAEYDWLSGRCHELSTPTRPQSLYGICKDALRQVASAYAREVGLSIGWGRLFFLYGPHEHPSRLIPSVIEGLLAGRVVECTAGAQYRDFLHVEDAAEALVALLASVVEGPVNIATGHAVTVGEVVGRIASEIGRVDLIRFGVKTRAEDDPPLLVADTSRLNREVGFVPRLDLAAGLCRTIDWWRERRGSTPAR
jgi:nucleoside-diphosphate-sugar epimerase